MDEPTTTPQSPRQTRKRTYSKHGTTALRRALVRSRKLDRRTRVGREMAAWRADLIRDLGGSAALSTAQLALVDMVVRGKLLIDSIDAWLIQPGRSLVNARNKSVIPIVRERTQLCESLARTLDRLGLQRVAADVPSLASYLTAKANGGKAD